MEKNGHEIHCIDISAEGYETEREHNGKITFGLSDDGIKKRIQEIKPDLIGIGCSFSSQFHNAVHVSKLAKEVSNSPVVVGGFIQLLIQRIYLRM